MNAPKEYKVKILKINNIAENTLEVKMEKPQGFEYFAGQYILILPEDGAPPPPYAFSLASAPSEKHLAVAMRISDSPFKKNLLEKNLGETLDIRGPFGTFGIHKDINIPAVFIAGGIGITLFRSIILEEKNENFPRRITLIYCNKKISSAAYYNELEKIQSKNLRLVNVLEETPKNWDGESGLLNENIIQKYITDITLPIYFVVGPPIMVEKTEKLLLDMGIKKTNIRLERFTGYGKR